MVNMMGGEEGNSGQFTHKRRTKDGFSRSLSLSLSRGSLLEELIWKHELSGGWRTLLQIQHNWRGYFPITVLIQMTAVSPPFGRNWIPSHTFDVWKQGPWSPVHPLLSFRGSESFSNHAERPDRVDVNNLVADRDRSHIRSGGASQSAPEA